MTTTAHPTPFAVGRKKPLGETGPELDVRGAPLTPFERETVVNASDGDDTVRIWTAQRKVITALRKRSEAVEVRSGYEGTTEWVEFEIPADRFNLAVAVRAKREISEERRRQMAETARKRFGIER